MPDQRDEAELLIRHRAAPVRRGHCGDQREFRRQVRVFQPEPPRRTLPPLARFDQRPLEGVPAHQLLGLRRERLGLFRELGGLGLRQQRAHASKHLLVHTGGGRGGQRDLGQHRQCHQYRQHGDDRGQRFGPRTTVALGPLAQQRRIRLPPHARVQLLQLLPPARMHRRRGALFEFRGDHVHDQRDRSLVEPADGDLVDVVGLPAIAPQLRDRLPQRHVRRRVGLPAVAAEPAGQRRDRRRRHVLAARDIDGGVPDQRHQVLDGRRHPCLPSRFALPPAHSDPSHR